MRRSIISREGEDEAAADANLDNIAEGLIAKGRKPYVIHLGTDHLPLGGLGYALGAVETKLQLDAKGIEPEHVVIGSGSGLTHAGFLTGARAIGWDVPIHGICVRRTIDLQQPRIEKRVHELTEMLGVEKEITSADISVDDTALKPGYGQLNDAIREAIQLTAQKEGVLLDPVYTGTVMAGLIDLLGKGKISQGESVLFIHTGGLPGIFAYEAEMAGLG